MERIPRLLPALAIAILAWLVLFPLTSVDVYYHLATGRWILDHGELPDRGIFSATHGTEPWHDNEWGFQVIAAAVSELEQDPGGVTVLTGAGRVRLILFRALVLAGTLGLLSATLARRGIPPGARALYVWLAAFLTYGNLFWAVRPQVLTHLGVAALLYLFERYRAGARRIAGALMLLVIAAWANVHGAFVIGIAMIGAEALGTTIAGRFRDPTPSASPAGLWWVLVLSPAAGCLNPHGYRQLLHPFLYLLRPEIVAGNVEWQAPDLLRLPLLMLTLAWLLAALALGGRPRLADLLRTGGLLAMFLGGLRHLPLLALVLVPTLAHAVRHAAIHRARAWLDPWAPGRTVGRGLTVAIALAAATVFLSGAFARPEPRFVRLVPGFAERPVRPLPENGVRTLRKHGEAGSVLNTYRFGGFLMLRLYPEERVAMDGRNDLYGTFRTETYNPVLAAEPGWEDALAELRSRFGLRYALLDEQEPLAGRLSDEPAWVNLCEDRPGRVCDGRAGIDGIQLFAYEGDGGGSR